MVQIFSTIEEIPNDIYNPKSSKCYDSLQFILIFVFSMFTVQDTRTAKASITSGQQRLFVFRITLNSLREEYG